MNAIWILAGLDNMHFHWGAGIHNDVRHYCFAKDFSSQGVNISSYPTSSKTYLEL